MNTEIKLGMSGLSGVVAWLLCVCAVLVVSEGLEVALPLAGASRKGHP